MILKLIRERARHLCLFVLICALMVALTGFGGSAQSDPSTGEPDAVGRVTNLVATTEGEEAGAVQLTWTAAENAQVHFVVYLKSADSVAGNYGAVQMVPFEGTQGVIRGLEAGTPYAFIAIGMRWNWINYGTVWGSWSEWTSATPSMGSNVDLVVEDPLVDPVSVPAGGSFTLSATVRNQGDGSSAASTLRYYRSTDSTITTSDTSVGTDAVGTLAASGTSAESIDLTAPSDDGTYYYGACVDAVSGESDTTNNCSGSATVTVSDTTAPDLAVGTPTVSDGTPSAGGSFTLSATVRNQGDASSAATTLRYYRSTDSTITTSDTAVGTDAVGTLAASGTSAESISLTAPSDDGTYYYGACVDTVSDESDTNNNCSGSVSITIEATNGPGGSAQGQAGTAPDLEVDTPTVSDSTPSAGGSFTLSATVRNQGDGSSAASTLRYYRSTDSTITTSDTAVGTDAVGTLAASGSSSESIGLTAPSSASTYYYGACVDAVSGESDTTNNCSGSATVTVSDTTAPELAVGTPTVSDGTPSAGGSFTLSATVRNRGDASSAATTLRYYRSTDSTITTSDTAVGTDAVGALAASGTSAESISLTAPSNTGTYYYGACVDTVSGESDTNNNCSGSVTVTVEETAPDLVVLGPSVTDSSPETGGTFRLGVTVQNLGNGPSAATTVRYYRSTDTTITTSDTEVGTDAVSTLAASGGSFETISLTAPSDPGTYYYGACVDTVSGESDTNNNCSRSASIVTDTTDIIAPDLVVAHFFLSQDPSEELNFQLQAIVRNRGDGSSTATTLRYYRSTDSTITTSDTAVGTDAVGALDSSGDSVEETIVLTAPSDPGTYYYGACVDAVSGESDTTNNCSSSASITVN